MRALPPTVRSHYTKQRRHYTSRPSFISLPQPLIWPNIELKALSVFSTGLHHSACCVLGAAFAGNYVQPGNLFLAILIILIVLIVYGVQGAKLLVFLRKHNDQCWVPSDPVASKAEVDDVICALLTNITRGLFPPMAREMGSFEPPDADNAEPGRTERALARFFSLKDALKLHPLRAGDGLAELETWLADSSGGSRRGVWYIFFMTVHQLVVATLLGFAFANPSAATSIGSLILIGLLVGLQVVGAIWATAHTANDKLDAVEKVVGYSLEIIATGLLFASALITFEDVQESAGIGSGQNSEEFKRLKLSLELATISSSVLMMNIVVPLFLVIYNSFIAPLILKVWGAEGNAREVFCQVVTTMILFPYHVASAWMASLGLGNVASMASELEGAVVDTAATSKDLVHKTEDTEDSEGMATDAPAIESQPGPTSAGALKRLKREAYLSRVRTRMEQRVRAREEAEPDERDGEA